MRGQDFPNATALLRQLPELRTNLLAELVDDRIEQVFPCGEMNEHSTMSHTGGPGDIDRLSGRDPPAGEFFDRTAQEQLPGMFLPHFSRDCRHFSFPMSIYSLSVCSL